MYTETTEDEDDEKDIKLDDLTFSLLNELVRKQYIKYLEKQILENVQAWSEKQNVSAPLREHIHECVELLEGKAIKSCMLSQLYQRKMLKIIENVRRYTKECRLERHLYALTKVTEKHDCSAVKHSNEVTEINNMIAITLEADVGHEFEAVKLSNEATKTNNMIALTPEADTANELETENYDFPTMSLDKKIELFQERLNKDKSLLVTATKKQSNELTQHLDERQKRKRSKVLKKRRERRSPLVTVVVSRSPTPNSSAEANEVSPKHKRVQLTANLNSSKINECLSHNENTSFQHVALANEYVEEDDNIAKELALLFSEEKTELDEIFGFDPNDEPDDPHISSILREIENSKLPHELLLKPTAEQTEQSEQEKPTTSLKHKNELKITSSPHIKFKAKVPHQEPSINIAKTLRNSIWPCELFMQRRRLNDSLNRLIEEDFRWHEIMKWKFHTLFGEDSDDEFAVVSPTIELNETLISSCIHRISPWIVKHLMKPMRDGLIANRFLFKKLAKRLAHSIVMNNQYPDERVIRKAVEHYFCLHQACVSIEDLADIPNITYNNDTSSDSND